MHVYLFAPDPLNSPIHDVEPKLRRLIPGLRAIERIEQAAQEIGLPARKEKVVVIFVSPVLAAQSLENFVSIASKHRTDIFFILISNDIAASDYKKIVQTGGADWVSANGSLEEVLVILSRHEESPSTTEGAHTTGAFTPSKANIVTFLPAMGGVGNTTIALEVALQLKMAKSARGLKVCYVDLDFQTSHICDYLDINPELKVEEIIDRPERMDAQLLGLFASSHKSGLDVFAAPPSKLDPCGLGIASLDALLDAVSRTYQIVVLDLPVFWFAWTAPIIENSDTIMLTALNSVPCLRQLRSTLDAVERYKGQAAQVGVIINRVSVSIFGQIRRRRHVERVVGTRPKYFIREDRNAVERINTGVPLGASATGASVKEFRRIAEFTARRAQ
jgi:pilus assembly protein CpaE